MPSPAAVRKLHLCSICPFCIRLSSSSVSPSPVPDREWQSSEVQKRGTEWVLSLWVWVCGGGVFSVTLIIMITLRMNDSRWISKDVSKTGQQWWGRKQASLSWVYKSFPLKSATSLNSNQAQDAWISIWVAHQRTERKEIWAQSRVWPKSFQVIPFGKETISFVCACSGKLPFWSLVHSQFRSQFFGAIFKKKKTKHHQSGNIYCSHSWAYVHIHAHAVINRGTMFTHAGIVWLRRVIRTSLSWV